MLPLAAMLPALLKLVGLTVLVVPEPIAIEPPLALASVTPLRLRLPATLPTVPLLVKVFGLMVKLCPAVLAMMLPLLTRLAELL